MPVEVTMDKWLWLAQLQHFNASLGALIIAFGLRSLYCISEAEVRCGRLDTFPSFGRLVAQRCTFSCLAVLYIVLPVHFLFEN